MEQEVCCSTGNLVGHYEAVRDLINSPHITDDDRWGGSQIVPTKI